jgi:hypothetical protein
MKAKNAETFVENFNDSFSDYAEAWADVHGEDEAEVVIEVAYRDENPQRLHLQSDSQALAVFQLVYASKEQGLQDSLGPHI